MIDEDGFRLNVGIILSNREGRVFWARRVGRNVWQFPQGGIQLNETPEQAMIRELHEETGLSAAHVEIIGCTQKWLRYRLPNRLVRRDALPMCIGQKQRWYAVRLLDSDAHVRFDVTDTPEFDYWKWVDYWHPLKEVVSFKRKVYEHALHELQPLLCPDAKARRVSRQLCVVGAYRK